MRFHMVTVFSQQPDESYTKRIYTRAYAEYIQSTTAQIIGDANASVMHIWVFEDNDIHSSDYVVVGTTDDTVPPKEALRICKAQRFMTDKLHHTELEAR